MNGSPVGQLSKLDWQKIAKGAAMAAIGAAFAYSTQVLGGIDWGVYGPLVAGLASVAANALHKFGSDTTSVT